MEDQHRGRDRGDYNPAECGRDRGDYDEFKEKYPNCNVVRTSWIGRGRCIKGKINER